MESKRIVICCDGTSNDSITTNKSLTNVSRLSRCIDTEVQKGEPVQIVYYQVGVGTSTSYITNKYDGATGRGFHATVRTAYNFLCLNWTSSADEIYLVGFSRGAYTVRCLVALITDVGLLTRAGLIHLDRTYQDWCAGDIGGSKGMTQLRNMEKRKHLVRGVKIEACAVWDTVSALTLEDEPVFGDHCITDTVRNVFHAVALNERRKLFKPENWVARSESTRVKQCWFIGAHSDVGGGGVDIGLSNISLLWMIAQLQEHTELKFSHDILMEHLRKQEFSPDISRPGSHLLAGFNAGTPRVEARGEVSDSVKGIFHLLGVRLRGLFNETAEPASSAGSDVENAQFKAVENGGVEAPATKQSIHFTVRTMMAKQFAECPAMEEWRTVLKKDEAERETRVEWRHRVSAKYSSTQPRKSPVEEESLASEEVGLLMSWFDLWNEAARKQTADKQRLHDDSIVVFDAERSLVDFMKFSVKEGQDPRLMYYEP